MDNECSICLENIEVKDLTILKCNHKFHTDCINTWIKKSPICPYCRTFLKSFFETKINFLFFFKRKCNIFLDEKDCQKVTFVYNYPFSLKPSSIMDIQISKIKSAEIKENYVSITYDYKKKKLKKTKFIFNNSESDIFMEKIKSLFTTNYNIYLNNTFQIDVSD